MVVSGWQQALTVLLAVIPGFVFQGFRGHFRGPIPEEREFSARILRALAISGLLAIVYVVALGRVVTDLVITPASSFDHPRATAALAGALVFVVPAIAAVAVHAYEVRGMTNMDWRKRFRLYDPTPTAWDFASSRTEPGFVRILSKEGTWAGGYAGLGSFFTGYPEMREVYLQEAWELTDDGTFVAALPGPSGVWIRCDDAQLVQFLPQQQP